MIDATLHCLKCDSAVLSFDDDQLPAGAQVSALCDECVRNWDVELVPRNVDMVQVR